MREDVIDYLIAEGLPGFMTSLFLLLVSGLALRGLWSLCP